MKEKDKYYIPSIEEFYDGFECEFKSTYQEGVGNDWEKIKYTQSRNKDFKSYLEYNQYRVKYLNKEDIESLGFIKEDNENKGLIFGRWKNMYCRFGKIENNKSYGITLYTDNIVDSTFIRIDGEVAPGAVYGHVGHVLFRGYIKNKSELKQLLKQLGFGFKVKDNKE